MSILIFLSICSGFLPQLWNIGWGTNGTDGDCSMFGFVTGVLLAFMIFVNYVELSRCHPADLRFVDPGDPHADLAVRQRRSRLGAVDQHESGQHHVRVVHLPIRSHDRVLHILLHRDHVQHR